MFNKEEWLKEQLDWYAEQRKQLAQAKQDRWQRANDHYNDLLDEIGFSNFILDLSRDENLKTVYFTTADNISSSTISCSCAGDADVIYFYVPDDIKDILVEIKRVEHVCQEDYATRLISALKGKGFYGIRHSYRIHDTFAELTLIAHNMEHRYDLSIKRSITASRMMETIPSTAQLTIDNMDGYQFEDFCARLLADRGYEDVLVTQGSGDQGIDIIAYKDGIKYGIQCKCYSSVVGNKAVQEVFAGKTFYQCHVGIVITNNYFSDSAIALARQNGIVLWNRDKLLQMLSECK